MNYTRFIFGLCVVMPLMSACSKHDPILPGERTAIFDTDNVQVLGENVPDLPDTLPVHNQTECPYTQDSSNVIRDGDRKIFSGFPTTNSVAVKQKPVCDGKFVYAGLTTGEVIKLNASVRSIVWITDVYRASNMTGGASMVDIVAPIVPNGRFVYVGGLGNAYCKLSAYSGAKQWCTDIGVGVPFIVLDNVSFVVGTDDFVYAIRNTDGKAYWRTAIKKQSTPKYENKILSVGREKINAETGEKIK